MEKKPLFTGPRKPGGSRPKPGQRNNRPGDRRNDPYATNERIRAHEVRLVGDNVKEGIYPIDKARRLAASMQLDLIEIAPQAAPPVCRILDYQKFLYQQKKRAKEQKAKAAKVVVKEIRFGPQTDDHDYNFKVKHAIGFLQDGCKVKAYVFFRGRSILFKDQGEVLLLRFASDLEEYGKTESMPVLEGKRMTIMLAPLKAPKKDAPKPKDDAKAQPKEKQDPKPQTPGTPAPEATEPE